MEYDLHNSVKQVIAVDPEAAAGASTVGNIIDTQGFESLEYVITSGDITTGDFTMLLEDGDDAGLSDAATVSSELVLGQAGSAFAVTDDNVSKRVGTISKKRYQRLTLVGANTPAGVMSAVAILGHPKTRPTDA